MQAPERGRTETSTTQARHSQFAVAVARALVFDPPQNETLRLSLPTDPLFWIVAAIGVTLLGISAILFFVVILGTLVMPKAAKPAEMPVAAPYDEQPTPKWLD